MVRLLMVAVLLALAWPGGAARAEPDACAGLPTAVQQEECRRASTPGLEGLESQAACAGGIEAAAECCRQRAGGDESSVVFRACMHALLGSGPPVVTEEKTPSIKGHDREPSMKRRPHER